VVVSSSCVFHLDALFAALVVVDLVVVVVVAGFVKVGFADKPIDANTSSVSGLLACFGFVAGVVFFPNDVIVMAGTTGAGAL